MESKERLSKMLRQALTAGICMGFGISFTIFPALAHVESLTTMACTLVGATVLIVVGGVLFRNIQK